MTGNDASQFGMAAALGQSATTLADAEAYTDAAIAALPPPGTGDVVGPASSTNNDIAQFNGTTGKLLKDGGLSSASFDAAGAAAAAQTAAIASANSHSDAADITTLASAATHSDNASNLLSGTIPNARIVGLPNANLANSAITINGHATSLGGSLTLVPGDLALTSAQLLVGNVSNVAAGVAMSGDTTITNAGVVTIKTDVALAGNPTTTTQSVGNNTTRLATTAFVTAALPTGANPSGTGSDVAVNGSATTFMRSDGVPAIQKCSSAVFGLAKVDNSTITAAAGVISAKLGGASWTPVDASGGGITFSSVSCAYVFAGGLYFCTFDLTVSANVSGATFNVGGLPATVGTRLILPAVVVGVASIGVVSVSPTTTTFGVNDATNAGYTNIALSGKRVIGTAAFTV